MLITWEELIGKLGLQHFDGGVIILGRQLEEPLHSTAWATGERERRDGYEGRGTPR